MKSPETNGDGRRQGRGSFSGARGGARSETGTGMQSPIDLGLKGDHISVHPNWTYDRPGRAAAAATLGEVVDTILPHIDSGAKAVAGLVIAAGAAGYVGAREAARRLHRLEVTPSEVKMTTVTLPTFTEDVESMPMGTVSDIDSRQTLFQRLTRSGTVIVDNDNPSRPPIKWAPARDPKQLREAIFEMRDRAKKTEE